MSVCFKCKTVIGCCFVFIRHNLAIFRHYCASHLSLCDVSVSAPLQISCQGFITKNYLN